MVSVLTSAPSNPAQWKLRYRDAGKCFGKSEKMNASDSPESDWIDQFSVLSFGGPGGIQTLDPSWNPELVVIW